MSILSNSSHLSGSSRKLETDYSFNYKDPRTIYPPLKSETDKKKQNFNHPEKKIKRPITVHPNYNPMYETTSHATHNIDSSYFGYMNTKNLTEYSSDPRYQAVKTARAASTETSNTKSREIPSQILSTPNSTSHDFHSAKSSVLGLSEGHSYISEYSKPQKVYPKFQPTLQPSIEPTPKSTSHELHSKQYSVHNQLETPSIVSDNNTTYKFKLSSHYDYPTPQSTTHSLHNEDSSIYGLKHNRTMSNKISNKTNPLDQPATVEYFPTPQSQTHIVHSPESSIYSKGISPPTSHYPQLPESKPLENESYASTSHSMHNTNNSIYGYLNANPYNKQSVQYKIVNANYLPEDPYLTPVSVTHSVHSKEASVFGKMGNQYISNDFEEPIKLSTETPKERYPNSTTHDFHNLDSSVHGYKNLSSKYHYQPNSQKISQTSYEPTPTSTYRDQHGSNSSYYGILTDPMHMNYSVKQTRFEEVPSDKTPVSTTHAAHNKDNSVIGLENSDPHQYTKPTLVHATVPETQNPIPLSTSHAMHNIDSSLHGFIDRQPVDGPSPNARFSSRGVTLPLTDPPTKERTPISTTHDIHNLKSSIYGLM